MSLPEFDVFKAADTEFQTAVLETLFEKSNSLINLTLKDERFMNTVENSYFEFIEGVRGKLVQLCEAQGQQAPSEESRRSDLSDIIAAHPKLGEPKQGLSVHSQNEQRNLGSGDTLEVQQALKHLNEVYEQRYPGLRFVVFVNGRSRPEIIRVMEERVNSGNSWLEEAGLACNEMCDIANDRVRKYVQ
ncbi:LAQU0S08e02146g1_1 [Lachancea quebecensis]|uniref:LAQU0S08e02146g1_1 n=1 Tax=Lachancea quebecensis TaxID=1654605 RepID=A0A0P1KV96_9SACH|nr:LAQU0S08e02146g1_1 [Lachancea quebecensis]